MLETHTEPLSIDEYELPISVQTKPGEYTVTVSFLLKEDTLWAERGHEVAFGQATYEVKGEPATHKGTFKVIQSTHNIGVKGQEFEVMFSYLNGGLVSYRYGGVEMMKMIPKPNFWRTPTDNDEGNLMPARYAQWKIASLYLSHKRPGTGRYPESTNPELEVTDNYVKITFTYHMPTTPAAMCKLVYTVYGDGYIETALNYDIVKELGDMPEFGVMFKVDADYNQVKWYGMGPEETYIDRCKGAKLGIYENKVEENMAKYLNPQECGNKTEVRWACVTDKKGRGLMFTGNYMNFSALPYTPHELENARHEFELPEVHYTVIRVSKQQMGIGGDDTWGARTHDEYLLSTKENMKFTFGFKGI